MTGQEEVEAGKGKAATGPEEVEAGKGKAVTGPEEVETGKGKAVTGPEEVKAEKRKAVTGPEEADAGKGKAATGQDKTHREAVFIEQARREWIPALKEIWKDAFGDREEEIEEFYRVFFREELSWCQVRDGRPVSVIYGLPALLWADDHGKRKQRLIYLYAGATAPDQRGKGYYGELLKSLCRECLAGRLVLCPVETLIPYYEKLGFSLLLAGKESELNIKRTACVDLRLEQLEAQEYKKRRDRLLGRAGYVEWDEAFFEYAIKQALRGGGAAAGFTQNGCEHLVLAVKTGSVLRIVESTLPVELLTGLGGKFLEWFGCRTLLLRQAPLMAAGPAWPGKPYFAVALED